MFHSSTIFWFFFFSLLARFVETMINGEVMAKELQYLEDAQK